MGGIRNPPPSLPPSPKVLEEIFIKNRRHQYFDKMLDAQGSNNNTDSIFYNRKELKQLLPDKDNFLEKKWKLKIIIDYTPRGNIIMMYDVYKDGFSYYCDQSSIPYPILNAIAMKYIYIYKCRDLFMDEQIFPQNPLIQCFKQEEQEEIEKKKQSFQQLMRMGEELSSHPFVKFKSKVPRFQESQQQQPTSITTSSSGHGLVAFATAPATSLILWKNKFIYLGKIHNFKLLSIPPPFVKNIVIVNQNIRKIFDYEHFDYKTFKKISF